MHITAVPCQPIAIGTRSARAAAFPPCRAGARLLRSGNGQLD